MQYEKRAETLDRWQMGGGTTSVGADERLGKECPDRTHHREDRADEDERVGKKPFAG